MTVRIGLCGFSMAMKRYPQHFPVVEVQQTFYDPPADGVILRWRTSVPADLEFTIKAWQLITHTAASPTYRRLRRELDPEQRAGAGGFRDTAIVQQAWEATVAAAQLVNATAILFQCPASFRPTDENVAAMHGFFNRIRRPPGVRLLWEPRGLWPQTIVRELCSTHQLVHVVDPFVNPTVTTGYTYYRLHGITGSRHVYTDAELLHLRGLVPSGGQTYVMFNNIPRVADALRFQQLLEPKSRR